MENSLTTSSDTEFRAFFELSPLGMAEVDLEGNFVRVNETLCRMVGYSESELLQMNISDLTHPDDIDDNFAFHPRAISGEIDRYHLEKRYVTRNDQIIWVLLTVIVFRDDKGRATSLLGQVLDITEQTKARQALEESESRFRSAFEHSPVAMDIVDLNGVIVEASPSMCSMLGYSEEELVGKNIEGFSEPDDMQQNLRLREQLASGRLPYFHMEKRYLRKDGETVYAILTASWVSDQSGNPLYYIGQMQDITERRRDEAAQRRSQELSEALNRIDVAMTSSLELDEIFNSVAEESRGVLGCDSMTVCLQNGPDCEVKRITGDCDAEISIDSHMVEESLKRCGSIGIEQIDGGSVLSAPLMSEGQVVGGIAFISNGDPDAFDKVLEGFVGRLATSVSLAVKNARMYAAEREIADTLQTAVLQLPVQIAACEFAHYYQSATKTAKVGGDFYDLFELDDNRVGILIGDVSGKGLEAAALTVLVKNTVKAYAIEGDTPARILTKTNEVAFRASPPSTFVTLFIGIINVATGVLEYCNAGHPPPLIVDPNGTVGWPEKGCPAVAMFQGIEYQDSSISLSSEQALVCFTDGVIEARQGKDLYGTDRLIEVLKTQGSNEPQALLDSVLSDVLGFTGGALSDDVAMMILRRCPGSLSKSMTFY